MRYNQRQSMIITALIVSLLISYASAQKGQDELRDADFYIKRGIAYVEKGQYDQAISDYNKALEINPNYAIAYLFK